MPSRKQPIAIAAKVAKVWIALLITELFVFGSLADFPSWGAGLLGGGVLAGLLLYFIFDDSWRELLTDRSISVIVLLGSLAIFGWPFAITSVRQTLTVGPMVFLGSGFLMMLGVVIAFNISSSARNRAP